MKIFIVVLAMAALTSCAIYDSKRGLLVTSSPVTVQKSGYSAGYSINISEFSMPAIGSGATASSVSAVGPVGLDINHQYIFNEVDRSNLRISLVNSLNQSGVSVSHSSDQQLRVEFKFVGMVEAGYGHVVPMFAGTMFLSNGQKQESREFQIKGLKKATVIGAKKSGIKLFVEEVHNFLQSS